MKKLVLLSTITSFVLIQNSFANTALEDVTVTTATKTEKNIDGVSASVIVITQKDIEKISASTLKDVFEKIPSINAQFGRFPHPSSASKASVSIRGAGANGTLILIDGKRLSGETEGPYELNRIPASMIERIEIVKGSMSTLYGSDAIGGVINIITKKVDKNSSTLDVKYGQNGHGEAKEKNVNFTTSGTKEDIKYKLFGSIIDTSSYSKNKSYTQVATNPTTGAVLVANPQNNISGTNKVTFSDDANVKNVGTRIEKNLNDNVSLGFDLNYLDENREGTYIGSAAFSGGGLIKNTPVNSEDNNRRFDVSSDLKYQINDDLSGQTKVYRSYYKKRNETTPINFAGPISTKFSANVTIDTIESNLTYVLNDSNIITTGLEFREETRDSSAINPIASSSDFITKRVQYKSLFIQDEIALTNSLNATMGARYDKISNADNKATIQTGLVQKLTENTNLRANYAQGYRAPDIAELYVVSPSYKDGKRFGSDVIFGPKTSAYELKPEQSQTFEIALSNRMDKLFSEIVLFNTKIDDKIELVSYGSGNAKYYTSENLDKVDIKGVELNLDYTLNDNADLNFNLTYLDTEDKSTNKELIFTPDLSASLGFNYKILSNVATNLSLRYLGEQYSDTQNTATTDDYTLVDVGVKYDVNKTLTLYTGIDNIFDTKIEEELGTNVGAYYFAGARINF
ncbi:TonB-dependent receptor plug domain-containing protein [Arcobacter caeni]|uniref:TonB-dependent receptor n=1 Tax=Arcobacter caeni TaxID=1912877 RepID=A0A363D454_9BACT|nr:TonB-dependent receptor [Arcobacter caeni]PUE66091.1 TonB-dependent receptor [Arcobacter caeni]